MKTILADMDDTITWLLPAWIKWLNRKHNLSVKLEDIRAWDMPAAFPLLTKEQIYEPLATEEFWDEVVPREGAIETLSLFHHRENYEVFICTSTDYRNIRPKFEKVIQRYFPFIDWNHVIVTSRKQMIRADYIIDDAVHNLIGGCQPRKILLSMPHNEDCDLRGTDILRANNWVDVRSMILGDILMDVSLIQRSREKKKFPHKN